MDQFKDKKNNQNIDGVEVDQIGTIEKDDTFDMPMLEDETVETEPTESKQGEVIDTNNYVEDSSEAEDQPLEMIESNTSVQKKPKKKVFSLIALFILAIIGMSNLGSNSSLNTSDAAKEAVKNHTSTDLPVGVQILGKDQSMDGQDYTIEVPSNQGEAKVYVWDYAAVDGDYVQLIVDGVPLGDPFLIDHKPKEFSIPPTSTVQVVGIKDGGGGITYAVAFDFTKQIYFNSTSVNASNTYTLIKK